MGGDNFRENVLIEKEPNVNFSTAEGQSSG